MKNTTQLKKQFNSRSVFLLIFVATVTLTLIWAVTGTSQISQAQPSLNISVTNSTVPVVSSQSTPTATQEVSTAAPSPEMLIESHPTGTPPSQGVVITVTAQTEAADWPSELDEPNHFNVSDIHTGTYQRDNYADAMQFDLSTIAPGSVIDYAAIEIKGLDDQHLNPDSEWQINLLNTTVDGCWFDLTPEALQPAPGDVTVPLNENTAQLVPGELSRFTFSDEARQNLQNCLGNGSISLRIDGSNSTEGNPLTRHNEFDQQTVLTLITLPPVETEEENQAPPTSVYTIVTSTPTPHNIVTAAAVAAEATHLASEFGTATPVPDNWVTPIVINPQPTPANTATALFRHQEATAAAFLYGPATATPYNVWTATPEPTAVEVSFVEEPTPTPTLPPTQTPVYIPVAGQVATPWVPPPPTATPIPLNIPEEIIGKIAFLSNRSGGPVPLEHPLIYLIDPDGSNLAVMTGPEIYEAAKAREIFSADQRFRVFVKDALRFDNAMVPALYFFDYHYGVEHQVTRFGAGKAWEPAWSPTREQMTFVSNDSKDNEIWVIDRDGSNAQRLTSSNEAYNAREIGKDTFVPEMNGHPSFSPDGNQIVFWSNRSGNRQIWVMDIDGRNLHSLSTTNHDDWNPVWIKYSDEPRSETH